MRHATLQVELLGPWHVSSGEGAGPSADATVVRTRSGLPYLPGRTLRGLLRDGFSRAEELGRVSAGRTEELFGSWSFALDSEGNPLRSRRESNPGTLYVDSATLPAEFEAYAENEPVWAEAFVRTVSMTALADGLAQDHTLRTIEVAVPMTLEARLEGPEEGAWLEELPRAFPWIRGLGLLRSRGYGRVRFGLQTEEVARG